MLDLLSTFFSVIELKVLCKYFFFSIKGHWIILQFRMHSWAFTNARDHLIFISSHCQHVTRNCSSLLNHHKKTDREKQRTDFGFSDSRRQLYEIWGTFFFYCSHLIRTWFLFVCLVFLSVCYIISLGRIE